MSLFGMTDKVPEAFIISIINSTFMSHYVDDFVNNTQTFQINDARQLPIIIPDNKMLSRIKNLFEAALKTKRTDNDETMLVDIQKELDSLILQFYNLYYATNS